MCAVLLLLLLCFGACTLAQPSPETVPMTTAIFLPSPMERVEIVQLTSPLDTPSCMPVSPIPAVSRSGRAPDPLSLVQAAQKAARVFPTERGFYGASGEYTYSWAPGKVYTVYLSQTQPTGIFLPPGERMVSGLFLNADAFDVKTERAGIDLTAYDAITIRPLTDTGSIDSFILAESGRRYLFHFIVGKVGMLAVTFERPMLTQSAPEPRLILPKPPQ